MEKKKITIKAEHILLLKRANITAYDDTPALDVKRPFGNSDIENDICKIVGFTKNPEYDEWSTSRTQTAQALYDDMLYLLKVLCQNPHGIEVGATYQNMKDYGDDWRRVS